MGQIDKASKVLFAMHGFDIRCHANGRVYTKMDKSKSNYSITNISKAYYPLQWIAKHKYILVDIEKRLLGKR